LENKLPPFCRCPPFYRFCGFSCCSHLTDAAASTCALAQGWDIGSTLTWIITGEDKEEEGEEEHYISPPGKRGFIDLQSRTLFIAKYSLVLWFSEGLGRTKRQRYLDLKSEIPPPWDPPHCARPNGPFPPSLGKTCPGAYYQSPFQYASPPAGPCVAAARRTLSHSHGVLAAPPSRLRSRLATPPTPRQPANRPARRTRRIARDAVRLIADVAGPRSTSNGEFDRCP